MPCFAASASSTYSTPSWSSARFVECCGRGGWSSSASATGCFTTRPSTYGRRAARAAALFWSKNICALPARSRSPRSCRAPAPLASSVRYSRCSTSSASSTTSPMSTHSSPSSPTRLSKGRLKRRRAPSRMARRSCRAGRRWRDWLRRQTCSASWTSPASRDSFSVFSWVHGAAVGHQNSCTELRHLRPNPNPNCHRTTP
mmetsp:Transcript_15112/g.25868  ORF Transcript_15112/g.25868 Transcript_15112/m.25868 type:complete len:200 (-) Transcript_15112:950-1549(-)